MSTHHDKGNQASAEERALDALGRRWSPGQPDEPPQLLDQVVLNAARREIEQGGAGRGVKWLGALATAAVVVLAVTLVVRQEPQPTPGSPLKEELRASPERPSAPKVLEAPARAQSVRPDVESEAPAPSRSASPATLSKGAASAGSVRPLRDEALEEPGAAEADATAPLPPQEWVQRMLDLQARGEAGRLRDELAAFRRSYPDYPLPPQLRNHEP